MSSKTTVAVSEKYDGDRFWLNGVESEVVESERLQNCLNAGTVFKRVTNMKLYLLFLNVVVEILYYFII